MSVTSYRPAGIVIGSTVPSIHTIENVWLLNSGPMLFQEKNCWPCTSATSESEPKSAAVEKFKVYWLTVPDTRFEVLRTRNCRSSPLTAFRSPLLAIL